MIAPKIQQENVLGECVEQQGLAEAPRAQEELGLRALCE